MPRSELERLHLSVDLRAALEETRRIKDIRALGRHYKRIANLLEGEEIAAVRAVLDRGEAQERAATARLHQLERWRERLIDEGDAALREFLDHYPQTDHQQLRSLIRTVRRDRERGRPETSRKLFRFLRAATEILPRSDAGAEEETAED